VKLLFQIYLTAVTFHTIANQRGGGQSKVALHATALGANGNNCERMQEQAWARTCRAQPCTGRQHVGRQLNPPFFSKNTPKLPFLAKVAQMNCFYFYFALSTVGSCPRLLEEHVQKIRKI
jgi:hypothetical protein